MNKSLRKYTNTCNKFESLQELSDFINDNDVFAASTTSVFNHIFACIKFEFCILDEASLVTEPLAIGPLMMANRFIMYGDYYLLNPGIKSVEADKKGMSVSLFRKLCEKHAYDVVILKK